MQITKNTLLLLKVRQVIERIQDQVATLKEDAIEIGEISDEVNAMQFAKRLDTMIQGAIFMTYTMPWMIIFTDKIRWMP